MTSYITPLRIALLSSLLTLTSGCQATQSYPLFDGESSTGWIGATDQYTFFDGEIVCKKGKGGIIFIGTKGILLQPHGSRPVPYLRENFEDYRYPKFKARDHYRDFTSAILGDKQKPLADFVDYGGPLTETVLLGALASRFPNETLNWDATNLRFTNSDEANQFITKKYRKGYSMKGPTT